MVGDLSDPYLSGAAVSDGVPAAQFKGLSPIPPAVPGSGSHHPYRWVAGEDLDPGWALPQVLWWGAEEGGRFPGPRDYSAL